MAKEMRGLFLILLSRHTDVSARCHREGDCFRRLNCKLTDTLNCKWRCKKNFADVPSLEIKLDTVQRRNPYARELKPSWASNLVAAKSSCWLSMPCDFALSLDEKASICDMSLSTLGKPWVSYREYVNVIYKCCPETLMAIIIIILSLRC